MTADMLISMRELDCRSNDGLRVRLLWCETDDRVFVAVNDHRTGESFSIEVPRGRRALDVFNHPYAYAPDHALPGDALASWSTRWQHA